MTRTKTPPVDSPKCKGQVKEKISEDMRNVEEKQKRVNLQGHTAERLQKEEDVINVALFPNTPFQSEDPVILSKGKLESYNFKPIQNREDKTFFNVGPKPYGASLTRKLGPLVGAWSDIISQCDDSEKYDRMIYLMSQIFQKLSGAYFQRAFSLKCPSICLSGLNLDRFPHLPRSEALSYEAQFKDAANTKLLDLEEAMGRVQEQYLITNAIRLITLANKQQLEQPGKVRTDSESVPKKQSQQLEKVRGDSEGLLTKQDKQREKARRDSDVLPKNYTESLDTFGYMKHLNLYYSKSGAREQTATKNMVYLEGDSNFNVIQTSVESGAAGCTDMLIMYQDQRKILCVLDLTPGNTPKIEEIIQLQLDQMDRSRESLRVEQMSDHGDIPGNTEWKQGLKDLDMQDDGIGFNSINKNVPKSSDSKRKNSEDRVAAEKGKSKEAGIPIVDMSVQGAGGLITLRVKGIYIGDHRPSTPRSTGSGNSSDHDLYASSYGEESWTEEGSEDSNADSEEERRSEIRSTPPSSTVRAAEEHRAEQDSTPTKDEHSGADGQQQRSEETVETRGVRDQRLTSLSPGSADGVTSLESERLAETIGRARQASCSASTVVKETEGKQETGDSKVTSGGKPTSRNMISAASSSLKDDEDDDIATDGATAQPDAQAEDALTSAQSPSLLQASASASATELKRTPPLSIPVQVSSPTNSECISPAYSEHWYGSTEERFVFNEGNGGIYENMTSSSFRRHEYELSSQLGAWGGQTPVVAQEQSIFCTESYESRPVEESVYTFTSHQQTPVPPTQSPTHLPQQPEQCTFPARQTDPSYHPPPQTPQYPQQPSFSASVPNFSQSDSQCSHAPMRLPPITVHAAGSLPPSATRTARINLREAANREFAPLKERRATYDDDWPTHHSGIDPANMALAGFFRHGNGPRRVRCFYCGLELELNSRHNVWDEHVRHRPTCPYLLAIMGEDFVLQTQIRLSKKP